MLLPVRLQTAILRVHAKAWTAVYRRFRSVPRMKWLSEFANVRRCWYLRAWYANANPSFERFCEAVNALDGKRSRKSDFAGIPTVGETKTMLRRPLTPKEREWVSRFPKYDENGEPFEQMAKLAKHMDEGFRLFDGK